MINMTQFIRLLQSDEMERKKNLQLLTCEQDEARQVLTNLIGVYFPNKCFKFRVALFSVIFELDLIDLR